MLSHKSNSRPKSRDHNSRRVGKPSHAERGHFWRTLPSRHGYDGPTPCRPIQLDGKAVVTALAGRDASQASTRSCRRRMHRDAGIFFELRKPRAMPRKTIRAGLGALEKKGAQSCSLRAMN
jgi:hypothetical protein